MSKGTDKNIFTKYNIALLVINFILAALIAYIPIAKQDYENYKKSNGLSYIYSVYEDYGLIYLKKFYKYSNVPADQLRVNYRKWIEDRLVENRYSIPTVINRFEVSTPIMFADSIISNTHSYLTNVIERPYCLELTINNNSESSIFLKEVKIKTNSAYSEPFFITENCDPDNTKYSVIPSKDSGPGYVIKPEGGLQLSTGGYLRIFLFFKEKISIDSRSYISYTENGKENANNKEVYSKKKEDSLSNQESIYKIFLKYVFYMLSIFFSLAGILSIIKLFLRLKNKESSKE